MTDMNSLLKQSTATTIKMGPFVDSGDGDTVEAALTIQKADVKLSKNAGALTAANANQGVADAGAAYDADGDYNISLNATDTNTLGNLRVQIHKAGALAVWRDFTVVSAAIYDVLITNGNAWGTAAQVSDILSDLVIAKSDLVVAISDVGAIGTPWAACVRVADTSNTRDEYLLDFYNGNTWQGNGHVTAATMNVYAVSGTGTALITAAALTEIGTTGHWRYYATGANRVTTAELYAANGTVTIDGVSYTWAAPVVKQ